MNGTVDDRIEQAGAGSPPDGAWVRVCRIDDLTPGRGAAARIAGQQVAIFRLAGDGASPSVFAIGNRCPFSGAQVMSRGIVGDAAGVPKVASPVYKQGFDLRTGACLEDAEISIPSYPVQVTDDGWVTVAVDGA